MLVREAVMIINTSFTFATRVPGTISDIRPRVEDALRSEGLES